MDRTEWNLINTISGADRVLLALPLDQVLDTLKAAAQDFKPGCVIMDTADVKAPANAAAAELLPKGVHFVGGHPILIPANMDPDKATADLFDSKLFCLTPDSSTDGAAVHLAADLVEALGAKPFFLDPVEHDGMAAAVSQLPQLRAATLMDVTSQSRSWQDMRKLAGGQFYSSTLITEGNGRSVVAGLTANREHVMLWLDELTSRLAEWRQVLTDGKEDALAAAIDDGLAAGEKWMEASITGRWEEERDARRCPRPAACSTICSASASGASHPPGRSASRAGRAFRLHSALRRRHPLHRLDHRRRAPRCPAQRRPRTRYTRIHRPVVLVYREETPNRSTAMRRELAIKKLDRERKERLVELNAERRFVVQSLATIISVALTTAVTSSPTFRFMPSTEPRVIAATNSVPDRHDDLRHHTAELDRLDGALELVACASM